MKKIMVFVLLLTVLPAALFAYETYDEAKDQIREYYKNKEFRKAEILFRECYDAFPGQRENITLNLLILYARLGQEEEGLALWKKSVEAGTWLFADKDSPWVRHYSQVPGYDEVYKQNEQLRGEVNSRSRMDYKVVLPEGYESGGGYGLFIALHGGMGNNEEFSKAWRSPLLEKKFAVLFIQSSRHGGKETFVWEDREKGSGEVMEALDAFKKQYGNIRGPVIAGGFSAGATQILHMIMDGKLPDIDGFIFLAPQIPDNFDEANITAAAEKGVRGYIFTGEKDHNIALQEKLHEGLEKYGLKHKYHKIKEMRHMYPEDLSSWIDKGIKFIEAENN